MGNEIPKFYVCNDGVIIDLEGDNPITLILPYAVWDGMVEYARRARDPQKLSSLDNEVLGKPKLDFDQLLKEIKDAKDK